MLATLAGTSKTGFLHQPALFGDSERLSTLSAPRFPPSASLPRDPFDRMLICQALSLTLGVALHLAGSPSLVPMGRAATVSSASSADKSSSDKPSAPLAPASAPTADTEALRFGAQYRGAARARFAQPLAFVSREKPFFVTLSPLVELHNDPGPDGFLPNENWRARIGLVGGRRWAWNTGELAVGLAIEHESDHSTSRFDDDAQPWFLSLNDAAVEVALSETLEPLVVSFGLASRLYFATCTRLFTCERSFQGSTTWGTAANASLTTSEQKWGFRPFVAVHGALIVGNGEAIFERRLVVHAGFWRQAGPLHWEIFGLGFFGNDTGFFRGRTVHQAGLGMRFWLARSGALSL